MGERGPQPVRVVRSGLGQLLLLPSCLPSDSLNVLAEAACFSSSTAFPPLRRSVPAVYNVTTTNEDRRRGRAPARPLARMGAHALVGLEQVHSVRA